MTGWGFSPRYDEYLGHDEAVGIHIGGTGSAHALGMTQEHVDRARKKEKRRRKQPFGFSLPDKRK